MKIMLSAYACEPNKGSEPGVGWNWAIGLAKKGHEVWVLTRANNKSVIDREFQERPQPANLHFFYYDLPSWIRRWKKGNRGVYFYYLLWQLGAYKVAKKTHAKEKFDLVHHVTFVSVRQPSFMVNLGIPFIFGPVAGGENSPWRLRFCYGARGFIIDAVRDLLNLLVKLDPLMWLTFSQAQKIYVTSGQTKTLVPSRFHYKTKVQLAIGLDSNEIDKSVKKTKQTGLRILYVGHFLYLKGMGLGIRAFAKLVKQVPGTRLTMVGKGSDEKRWRDLAERLNIADKIDWIPWVNRKELAQIYQGHDVFLFPSLHDSGGMVVLEAMTHGLPVVCLDLGGPGQIVNSICGKVIITANKNEQDVVLHLSEALCELARDLALRSRLRAGALRRAKQFQWSLVVAKIYNQLINRENTSNS